jgi:predicted transcriptional regulator
LDRSKIVLDIIEKNPGIRFNEIMRITGIKNGTLSHYVKRLEKNGTIKLERTPRVTRAYPVGIAEHEATICKYITMPTQKKLILFLLKKEVATSIEIREFLKKSPSVISVNLNELFRMKIINKRYDIPSNKYSLKNPKEIEGVLKEHYPKLLDKLSENTIEMLDF